jgi:hypothetical protein
MVLKPFLIKQTYTRRGESLFKLSCGNLIFYNKVIDRKRTNHPYLLEKYLFQFVTYFDSPYFTVSL